MKNKKQSKALTVKDGQKIKYKNKTFVIKDGELHDEVDSAKVDFVKSPEKYKVYLSFNKSFPLSDLCDVNWLKDLAEQYLDEGINPRIFNLENHIRKFFDPVELMDIDQDELKITVRKEK